MTKLHILRGLPASGKSTYARELVRSTGNTVRINRDDLRAMMFESKWTREREKLVVKAEKTITWTALAAGQNVVVDDTNLLNNIWPEFAREYNAHENTTAEVQVTTHDFDASPEECVRRDALRSGAAQVGPGVIYRMAAQAERLVWRGRPVVICDLDGTICDLTHRLHYLETTPKDYDNFFEKVIYDRPIYEVISQVETLSETHDVVFVSGRSDVCASATVTWLYRHVNVKYVALLMRKNGDHRPDVQVKNEILGWLPKERIVLAIDDRPSVINGVWKAAGIPVHVVNQEAWAGRE